MGRNGSVRLCLSSVSVLPRPIEWARTQPCSWRRATSARSVPKHAFQMKRMPSSWCSLRCRASRGSTVRASACILSPPPPPDSGQMTSGAAAASAAAADAAAASSSERPSVRESARLAATARSISGGSSSKRPSRPPSRGRRAHTCSQGSSAPPSASCRLRLSSWRCLAARRCWTSRALRCASHALTSLVIESRDRIR